MKIAFVLILTSTFASFSAAPANTPEISLGSADVSASAGITQ